MNVTDTVPMQCCELYGLTVAIVGYGLQCNHPIGFGWLNLVVVAVPVANLKDKPAL